MKSIRLSFIGALSSILLLTACQRTVQKELVAPADPLTGKPGAPAGPCNPNAYTITLEGITQVGSNWEWVWSVQNPNPGNGNNGTVQDLSHWGMQFGSCFQWSSVVSAAYSSNGTSWHSVSPGLHVDPSQNCLTTPVLKFDYGTSGGNKSYYKLVVNSYYNVGQVPGYYKSGSRTGCCTFQFTGIGCNIATKAAQ